MLLSHVVFCTHLEEGMSGHFLKYDFVLQSICVTRAHADLLRVRAVPARYRCTIYGEVLSLLPGSASTAKRAVLGAGSSRGSSQVTCWDPAGGTSSDPSCSRDCKCVPGSVTALLSQAPWCMRAGKHGRVTQRPQPCRMLWKDGGFSLVLSDGIRQHPQHCTARSQDGGVQGCGMEKGVLAVLVAEFVLRIWSLLLWKRFADRGTHGSACSTPSGGAKTRGQGEAFGAIQYAAWSSFGSLHFLF